MNLISMISKKTGAVITVDNAVALLDRYRISLNSGGPSSTIRVAANKIAIRVHVLDDNDDTVYGPVIIPALTMASIAVVGFPMGSGRDFFKVSLFMEPMRQNTVVRRASASTYTEGAKSDKYVTRPDFSTPLKHDEWQVVGDKVYVPIAFVRAKFEGEVE